jgi:FMN phosphatase YigB (HAD superfamily)
MNKRYKYILFDADHTLFDFDQSEKMQLNDYSAMVISQIKTETLNLSSIPVTINYMLDENGNYVLDENNERIVI